MFVLSAAAIKAPSATERSHKDPLREVADAGLRSASPMVVCVTSLSIRRFDGGRAEDGHFLVPQRYDIFHAAAT